MSYTKQVWTDLSGTSHYSMTAAKMAHIEDGIEAADSKAEASVQSNDIDTIVVLSQGDYDLIAEPDPNTLYIIEED